MAKRPEGKYDKVLHTLPRLGPEDESAQSRIEALKKTITTREAVFLGTSYALLRVQKKQKEAELKTLNEKIAAHEQLLIESQETQSAGWGDYGANDNMLRLETGETIRIQPEPIGMVKDKETFRRWCIKNGYENQLHLHSMTMNTVVKERLLSGDALPDGCEVFARTKIFYTKGE